MNGPHFCFTFFNLKILSEIVTPKKLSLEKKFAKFTVETDT